MINYLSALSLTHNSIYSLHLSYYSIDLAFCIVNIIILSWLIIWFINYFYVIYVIYVIINYFYSYLFFTLWLSGLNWMNDILLECFLCLTLTEQFSLINGIKWLIFSEWMLFYGCFWSLIHFRLISPGFSLFFSYPLLSSCSFAIPISNFFILIFSSVPIQSTQIFVKIGFFILTMEGLGQSVCCAFLFIILQCKEFLYSYFSLSDSMIGCIFYFTTGLHGIHVLFGCFFFFILIFHFNLIISYNPIFFIEYSSSISLCSYYWHFVDWIWLTVYLYYLV